MRINTCFKNLTSNFLQDQVEYSNQNAFKFVVYHRQLYNSVPIMRLTRLLNQHQ